MGSRLASGPQHQALAFPVLPAVCCMSTMLSVPFSSPCGQGHGCGTQEWPGTLHYVDQYLHIQQTDISITDPEEYFHMLSVENCFMCSSPQMRWTHSYYRMQQGRRPCSRNSDDFSSTPFPLPLVILDLVSQPRTAPSHLKCCVYCFSMMKVLFLKKGWVVSLVPSTSLSYSFPRDGGRI